MFTHTGARLGKIQIKAFFRFCRVKITAQRFHMESNLVFIETEPDKRYHPVCHNCGFQAKKIHSYNKRMIRDLNIRMNAYASSPAVFISFSLVRFDFAHRPEFVEGKNTNGKLRL